MGWMSEVHELAARAWFGVSDDQLLTAVRQVFAAEAMLQAAKLRLVRELDARGLPQRDGAATTSQWLCFQMRVAPTTARGLVALAAALQDSPVGQALADGDINLEQATVINRTVGQAPAGVREAAQKRLIGDAAQFGPHELAKLGQRIAALVDPDGTEAAEAERLAREEQRAIRERGLHLTDLGDGRVRLSGWLPTEAAAILRTALDALCHPRNRPAAPNAAAPNAAAPNAAAPNAAAPDVAEPDAATPDVATPDAATPDVAEPDATAPDATAPDPAAASRTVAEGGAQDSSTTGGAEWTPSEADATGYAGADLFGGQTRRDEPPTGKPRSAKARRTAPRSAGSPGAEPARTESSSGHRQGATLRGGESRRDEPHTAEPHEDDSPDVEASGVASRGAPFNDTEPGNRSDHRADPFRATPCGAGFADEQPSDKDLTGQSPIGTSPRRARPDTDHFGIRRSGTNPHRTDPHHTGPQRTDPHHTDPHHTDPHHADPQRTDLHHAGPHHAGNDRSAHECLGHPRMGGDAPRDDGAREGAADVAGRRVRDPRTLAQRRADALVDIAARALAHGNLPRTGGQRPQLIITLPWTTLANQIGTATLADGIPITASTARRLACDADLLPAVLDSTSQPLDVGRTRRLVSTSLRTAVILRDRGCVFPMCDRPPSWTEIHHIRPWIDGGQTALTNLAALCRYHHRVVHQGDWRMRINPADGHPDFYPPPHLHLGEGPLRNPLHQL